MEYIAAEGANPALYQEIRTEFLATWKIADANADGVLDCNEFKVFVEKHNENMKKRLGQSEKGDEREDEKWFEAYNSINPSCMGVSLECFETGKDMIMEIMRRKGFA